MDSAIAIIGMGARFPGAPDLAAYRRLLRAGQTEHSPVPSDRWDHAQVWSENPRHANHTRAKQGAFMTGLWDFAPEFFGISPKRARIMDPQQRWILEISRQALEDAGYAQRRLAEGRVGVYVGASSVDFRILGTGAVMIPSALFGRAGAEAAVTAEAVAAIRATLPALQGYTIVGQQHNIIAANVSQAFDFTGPSFTIDTACSSALAALHEAVLHLRAGVVDAALVGGVYAQLDPALLVCFSRIGAVSFTDECRPFQTAADGFVLGEGVGMVVVKRLADAVAAGDRVLAVVRGIGMNNDGQGGGPLTPLAAGQTAVMARAWADAGADPATVGLLEAHGTATPAGDGIELAAMTEFFAKTRASAARAVPLTSVKANIGHGLSSAGIASLIKATLAVHEGVVFPQPCAGPLRAEFAGAAAWLRVPTAPEAWAREGTEPRRAGVNAFGFGGTNVHVVLEESPARPAPVADGTERRCVFSAPNAAVLADYLGEVERAVREEAVALGDVAFTLARRRKDRVSTVVAATDATDFLEKIAARRAALARGDTVADEAGDDAGPGELISLPPSRLAPRHFGLIDETKRRPGGAPVALAIAAAPVVPVSQLTEQAVVTGEGLRLVAEAVAAVTALRAEDVRPEQRFVGDLGFDSLTTLEFMTVLGRSRPGGPPPPRTLFTAALTVAQLVAALDRGFAAAPEANVIRFETARHPWLAEHRPAGRARLPMAAMLHAALRVARTQLGASASLTQFNVLAPVEVTGAAVVLKGACDPNGALALQRAENGELLATGVARTGAAEAWTPLVVGPDAVGELSLPQFYATFGFHGPALQALVATPMIGASSVRGELRTDADEVVILDGALQLALYWLAARRGRVAMATGFAEFRQAAPWPTTGHVTCRAVLTGESGSELRADFDFLDANGAPVAHWRGVEAQVLAEAGPPAIGPVAEWPEVRALAARKAAIGALGLAMPYFHEHEGRAGAVTRIGGREFVNFSSYDYLGLAGDPTVERAVIAAVERYGTSASASRVASGERPLHGELERALADFLGCGDALALVSGHATNVAVIGHLLGPEDLVVHDSLAHDCIVTGARLSGARRLAFPHNDMAALDELLTRERPKARRALIAVEGVYSMDGDLAPLPAIVALKRKHDALVLLDEAHSLGVLGATGRGAGEHFSVARGDVDLWMGTMSKTLASCGGYLAGAPELIDYLRFTLPGFVYSVGLSPANAAAALAALRILVAQPERATRLRLRSDHFRTLCRERGIDIGASADSAVVPAITGDSERALRLAQALGARGINVQPIFAPAVEEGKARLRFFVTAEHTEAQLRATAEAVAEELAALRATREETRA